MWGAAPPAPAPGGRADGAGREGSAGRAPGCPHLRVGPPRREGAGCVSSFHPLCGAAQARAAARGALSSPGGDGRSRVGWGGVLSALVPSPGVPHSPSAATAGDLPLAWAHRPRIKLAGPGGRRGDYARSPGGPGVRVVALGCILPGPSFMFVMVSRRPPGPRELGEAGERRPGGVGLPAVSHGPLPLPRPCRHPTPARPGQRPPWATAEPGKSPGRMLRDPAPGFLGEKGGVRTEGRLEGGTRAFSRAPVSP